MVFSSSQSYRSLFSHCEDSRMFHHCLYFCLHSFLFSTPLGCRNGGAGISQNISWVTVLCWSQIEQRQKNKYKYVYVCCVCVLSLKLTCAIMWCILLEQRFPQIILCGSDSSEEGELGSRLETQATWQHCGPELRTRGGIHCHKVHCQGEVLTVWVHKLTCMAWVCVLPTLSTTPRGLTKGHRSLPSAALLFSPCSAFVYSWLFVSYSFASHLFLSTHRPLS